MDFANNDSVQQYLSYISLCNLATPRGTDPASLFFAPPVFKLEEAADAFAVFGCDLRHADLAQVPEGRLSVDVTFDSARGPKENIRYYLLGEHAAVVAIDSKAGTSLKIDV